MKMAKMHRLTALFLTLSMLLSVFSMLGTSALATENDATGAGVTSTPDDHYMKLWYDEPAKDWKTQALPIGNGNLGGMIFGKTDTEHVQINEITLWAGGPNSTNYTGGNTKDAYKKLPGIRDALFSGDYAGASRLAGGLTGNERGWNGYQNIGDFTMAFSGNAMAQAPTDYQRELDLEDGVQRVRYTNGGVQFDREYFCSNPGNVMVVRLTADKEDELAFKLALTPDVSSDTYNAISKTFTTTAADNVISCMGEVTSSKMKFAVQLKVVAQGATIENNADGTIDVTNGEDVLIFMTAGTNYDIKESDNVKEISDFTSKDTKCDYLNDADPNGELAMAAVAARIAAASKKDYSELLKAHQADYQQLFSSASIQLGDDQYAETPTDELLKAYNKGDKNQYLETLLFQYGRYMLISSSRDAVLPANLQGLWNNDCDNLNSWSSDYHYDVNLQMNYWPAFVTNLSETADPLVSLMESLRAPGNLTAREHFGVQDGWVVNASSNTFGMTAVGWGFNWGYTPGSGAWLCNNLWDYYQFTQDPAVLTAIYPILKGAAQFWQGYLVEDPNTGELVTAPSASPEHGTVGIGATYDMALACMLMNDVIDASEILGEDIVFRAELQALVAQMDPLKIGDSGQIKEWREETAYNTDKNGQPMGEAGHRHMSHLLGLHPGNLVTTETPELMEAAIKTLQLRGDGGGYGTGGWSMAQKANLWARTGNGDEALRFLRNLFNGGIYTNLFDQVNNVFQIDGNFGATSAIAEMLLQSHAGYIQPLPALPTEWSEGSYQGLVARGDFEIDADWESNSLTALAVRSGKGGLCTLRYPNISANTVTAGGKPVVAVALDANTIAFETEAGAAYEIGGFTSALPMPANVKALRTNGNSVSLTWDAVADAESYRIYRKSGEGDFTYLAANVTALLYQDVSALPEAAGERFSYKVTAVNAAGEEGAASKPVVEMRGISEMVDGNDKRVKYTGSWNLSKEGGYYADTVNYAWTPGDTAELEFVGTGIVYYARQKADQDAIDIYIDDVLVENDFNLNSAETFTGPVFTKTGLAAGQTHTIKLVIDDDINADVEFASVNIDGFRIINGDETEVEKITILAPSGVGLLQNEGESLQLLAQVAPLDAADSRVSWAVTAENGSATELASIDQQGLLCVGRVKGKGNVKVTATACDGSGVRATHLVNIQTDHRPLNLALNQAITSAGVGINGSHPLKNINDGSYTTRLATTAPAEEVINIDIDLGAEQTFNKVEIAEYWDRVWNLTHPKEGDPRIDSIDVQVPDGSGGWRTVGQTRAPFVKESDAVQRGTVTFEPVRAQKVRLAITDTEKSLITVWEIEIFSDGELVTIDRTALLAALESAGGYLKTDFTEAAWTAFDTARQAAIATSLAVDATQAAVDAAASALTQAIGTVKPNKQVLSIRVRGASHDLPVGRSMPLEVTADYDRGQPIILDTGVQLSVKDGSADVVEILSDNTIKAVAAGAKTIVISYTENGKEVTAEYAVTAIATQNAATERVVYHLDGGTNHNGNATSYLVGIGLGALRAPFKSGHTFAGWYDAQTAGNRVTEITAATTGEVTLYARWTANAAHQITYVLAGGVNHADNPATYQEQTNVALKPATRPSHYFLGWFTAQEGGARVSTIGISATKDITLYARWNKAVISHKITYQLDGGTNHANNPDTFVEGKGLARIGDPTKLGFSFIGWFDAAIDGNAVTAISETQIGKMTLYARWQANAEHTITYALDGGINNSDNPETYFVGAGVPALRNPIKKGVHFAGWYDAADGGNRLTAIAPDHQGNITLYARWSEQTGALGVLLAPTVTSGKAYSGQDPRRLTSTVGLSPVAPTDIEAVTNKFMEANVWHMGTTPGADGWIEFDFLTAVDLQDMYVWNHNRKEYPDRQSKDIEIYYTNDGKDVEQRNWTKLDGTNADKTFTVAQAPNDGAAIKYQSKFAIGQLARYVKILVKSSYGSANYWALDKVLFTAKGDPTVLDVRISPASTTLRRNQSAHFSATLTGYLLTDRTVQWTVAGNQSEKTVMDADGKLTIAVDESARNLTVKAVPVQDGTRSGIATVKVKNPLVNLALKTGPADEFPVYTASSHGAVAPDAAFDGATDTEADIWIPSGDVNTDAWIAVDFGQEVTFEQIKLYDKANSGSRLLAATVQTSADGETWTDAQKFTFAPDDAVKIGTLLAPISAQYLRLTAFASSNGSDQAEHALALIEAEIYGDLPEAYHAVTASSAVTGGIITTSPTIATEGTEVLITLTPDAGMRITADSLRVYETGNVDAPVALTAQTFTMPGFAVTVTAAFEKIPSTGSADTTTTTQKNEDGSISTIVTDKKTGQTVETALYPNGAKVTTTTPKDGAPASAVSIPAAGEKTTVTIPTTQKPAAGTVAVIVKGDGTKEIIRTSVATDDGMRITLTQGARIELIDNRKTFADVKASDWHESAVTFVTSRELFNGTATDRFAPTAPMTRAMLMTVLYRYEGASVKGTGDAWYADSMAWAQNADITDGKNPNGNVSREQLATILYRYAQQQKLDVTAKGDTAAFADGGSISAFASEAMRWAVGSGLLSGKGNRTLDPQGSATRAEVAAILMRFCENVAK